MVKTRFIVAAALGTVAAGLHGRAGGQGSFDGVYAGKVTTAGRCMVQDAEVNVSIQGTAVAGTIVSTAGRTPFAGTLKGNSFSIETTGTSESRVALQGDVARDGTKLDVTATITNCAAKGQLNRRP